MTAVTDFATKQQGFITGIETAITDITAEIQTLKDTIATLQAGGLSADDQAALDAVSTSVSNIETSLQNIDTSNAPSTPANGSGTDTTPPASS